jgi:hypothetical protein
LTRNDAGIAVVVAAADFEWTLRRAIVALGIRPNKVIRSETLSKCFGLESYKRAWNREVLPHVKRRLTEVVPDWHTFTKCYELRNRLIHGTEPPPFVKYATEHVEPILAATTALVQFAKDHGEDLERELRSRRKDRVIAG